MKKKIGTGALLLTCLFGLYISIIYIKIISIEKKKKRM